MEFIDICKEIDAMHAAGEQDALFAAIRRLAMRRLRGDEDGAQDVVVASLAALPTYDPRQPFSHCVNAIITQAARNTYRREHAARRCVQLTDETTGIAESDFEFADTSTIDEPFIQVVAEMMQRGYTLTEIADMSEMTPDAVRQRVFRYKRSHEIPKTLENAA